MRIFTLIIVCLVGLSKTLIAQRIGSIHYDTTQCEDQYGLIDLNDRKFLTAFTGVENLLRELAGNKIISDHIWLNYCESRITTRPVYSKDRKKPWSQLTDTCYDLHFYVLDKNNTVGNFDLLVDKHGLPVNYEYKDPWLNNFALVKGFKKQFENQFKVNYDQAVETGRKKGYTSNPWLECETDSKFMKDRNNSFFIKVKYYWVFSELFDGHTASMEINAETGKIEKEIIIPRMPK